LLRRGEGHREALQRLPSLRAGLRLGGDLHRPAARDVEEAHLRADRADGRRYGGELTSSFTYQLSAFSYLLSVGGGLSAALRYFDSSPRANCYTWDAARRDR